MGKKGFVLYKDWQPLIASMTNEQAGMLIKAIYQYQNEEEVDIDDPLLMGAFNLMKARFIVDEQLYEERCETNRKNGAKGGRPKKEEKEKPNGYLENPSVILGTERPPKKPDNDNDNDNDKDNDNEKDKDKEINKRKVKKKSTVSIYQTVKDNYPISDNMSITLGEWFAYRDSIHKPLTDKGVTQLIEKAMALEREHGYLAVKKCFDNSIENGYQGVFFDKLNNVTQIRDNKTEIDDWFRKELGG